ncbi:hypothetical protein F750_6149 [Streptomyces sp. PAMC 26508]|nr:hypothetical protein F750_6149 [Streptomyces sp. PAMC 26508]
MGTRPDQGCTRRSARTAGASVARRRVGHGDRTADGSRRAIPAHS